MGDTLDLFARRRTSGVAPRKSVDAAPAGEEQEPGSTDATGATPEAAPGDNEAARDKVVLRNPKWEVEKVGFNEETDISVEAEPPESQAHKTKSEIPTSKDAASLRKVAAELPEGSVRNLFLVCRTRHAFPLAEGVRAVPVGEA